MFVWPLLYSPLKVLYLSVLGNKSPKSIDSVRLIEGCAGQYGHTQGQRRSEAVNHPAAYVCECVRALYAELVNNRPTQDQTGPQSNQCGFNVHCPRVCVCLCECAGELDHWINPQGEEVDRIMTRSSVFISLSFSFSVAIFPTFLPTPPPALLLCSHAHHLLHSSLPYSSSLPVTLVQE